MFRKHQHHLFKQSFSFGPWAPPQHITLFPVRQALALPIGT